ncbi:hypothetical protein E5D57_013719 [Metarhizium anisopliae]|nr:hypothetical protein E5D57_013719 [Metarhizium anisopliae]
MQVRDGERKRLSHVQDFLGLNFAVAPNGASMRPNSPYQQSLVSWRFRGSDMIVYSVPKGTGLPDDLVLVHERSDHYSLQPAVPMTVDGKLSCMPFRNFDQSLTRHLDMNARMTNFFRDNAQEFTRDEWLEAYPKATESSQFHPSR